MATGNPYTTAQASPAMQLIAPDIAAQQLQLARQQQLGQMLRDQALAPADPTQVIGGWAVRQSPLAGLGKVLGALGAGYLQNETDQKQLDMARALQGRMADYLNDETVPPQNRMPLAAQPSPSTDGGMIDAGVPVTAGPAPGAPSAVPAGFYPPANPGGASTSGQGANNPYTLGRLLKGSVIGQIGGDAAAKQYWEQFAPTEATRLAMAAGIDPRMANQATLTKNTYIAPVEGRAGTILRNPQTLQPMAFNPDIPSAGTPVFDASGNVVGVRAIEGALPLMQEQAKAEASGKAAVEPIAAFDASGNPVFTSKLAASQGGQGGTPGQQVNAGRFGGYSAPGGNGAVRPGLAPGVQTAAEGMAKQNTDRAGALVSSAAESPTRVNVLDNIIDLSKSGVNSGPNADWVNKVKGAVADLPGFGGWKDDVTGFQELKKYMNQNALRAWQAAGGSGTDSQLNAAMSANPNDKMFPQAVQTMAQWAKAGELALQSKAAAQDSWLARNNNNPQAQNQFEAAWRQNFDPRIYQMKLMDPAQLQTFVGKIPQSERSKLLQKYSTAKQNGWIQ